MSGDRVLFIDLDGVIRRWNQPEAAIEAAYGLPAGALRQSAFAPELLLPAITGAISDELWRDRIGARLKKHVGAHSAHQAVREWSAPIGELDPNVLTVLDDFANAFRLVLITNATTRLHSDLRALGIDDRFDRIINSSAVGIAKPAREIYELALRLEQIAPEHALYVDDSPANIAAASLLGIRSHQFVDAVELQRFLSSAFATPT